MDNWENTSRDNAETRARYIERMFGRMGLSFKDGKILEVGSGNGFFLEKLRGEGADVVGVDRRPRGELGLPQAAADIEALPFADSTFQYVFSGAVFDKSIYTMQNQPKMLSEIARVLKPGGYYVGYVESIEAESPDHFRRISAEDSLVPIYQKAA